VGDAVDPDGGEEELGVVGAVVDDLVAGRGLQHPGGELLEARLVVLAARPGCRLGDAIEQEVEHEGGGGAGPGHDVDDAEHGLEGVGEDRRLLPPAGAVLALAEQQRLTEPELDGHLRQGGGRHDRRPDLGERPFGQLGVGAEQVVGDDDAEHGVAEELEPLVRRPAGVLGAPRPVHQRRSQQRGVVDGTAEPLVQLLEACRREQED
jgi:hypothetical protein